jgi:hypothetical protein
MQTRIPIRRQVMIHLNAIADVKAAIVWKNVEARRIVTVLLTLKEQPVHPQGSELFR